MCFPSRRISWLTCCLALLPNAVWAEKSAVSAELSRTQLPKTHWVQNGFAQQRFVISGTGGRNNPLRREILPVRSGDELFVRFRIRYDAESIDSPPDGDGEFFVLWLDETEGNNGSTHAGNLPNIGLHVKEDENRFMIRFHSSKQEFGPLLVGGRESVVVARLWKSAGGSSQPYDKLDLWVDPNPDAEYSPHASTSTSGSLSEVRWIGFSTGAKTEIDDAIEVWDVALENDWRSVLGLPPDATTIESEPTRRAEPTVSFSKDVYPILDRHCFSCHAGGEADSGIRLDIVDEMMNQTRPFDAQGSHLVQLIRDGEMPPEGSGLSETELQTLVSWIDEGLQWDEKLLPTPIPETQHWAFQPIRRPAIPTIDRTDWVRTPVDAFIGAAHQSAGLTPNPPADQETLARRLSLDMLGLPPGDTTIAVNDLRAGSAVDQVLAHPAYGVRWARHWLDLARWAESNGHQHNRPRLHAWRYRDWVVDAFNSNKPFDDFLREQIAGDLLRPRKPEHLIATGFLASARYSGNELDKRIQRNDILVDVTNVTASAFLGLTLQCAQCHTHKFDPISIRDFYRFQAFFGNGQLHNVALEHGNQELRELVAERWRIFDSVHRRLVTVRRKQGHPEPIYVIPKTVIRGMKPTERSRFNELDQQIAQRQQTWAFVQSSGEENDWVITPHEMRWPLPRATESLADRQTRVLIRGDVGTLGPTVQPGWPAVFGVPDPKQTKSRLDLASWLTDPGNPLTARVWVNRIWQWHFGRGLVETSSDFGTQGASPTHQDLLSFLASELIDSGWDTAHIHRLILNSSTYRQSHVQSSANEKIDPKNTLWWRYLPRRLEAEAIRDSLLAVSGRLDETAGGPSVPENSLRRSLYLRQERDALPSQQRLFDSADGIQSCARRRVSTNALQPLWLLNNDFAQSAAKSLAGRAGDLETAFQIALARSPSQAEHEDLSNLVIRHGLASACLVILNSSEFVYLP